MENAKNSISNNRIKHLATLEGNNDYSVYAMAQ